MRIDGVGDTAGAADQGAVRAYLRSLADPDGASDIGRLAAIQNDVVAEGAPNWQEVSDVIVTALAARHYLSASRAPGGNLASAVLSVCGRIVSVLEDYPAGDKQVPLTAGQREYSSPWARVPGYPTSVSGGRMTQRDSEVRLLGDLDDRMGAIVPQIPPAIARALPSIEIRITSRHGACSECKSRLEAFVQNTYRTWYAQFGGGTQLAVDVVYTYWSADHDVTRRNDVTTHYGWHGDPGVAVPAGPTPYQHREGYVVSQ
jgi:hypothetical protein